MSTNANWQTSTASVSVHVGNSAVALTIAPTQNRSWSVNNLEVQEVAGCTDLDLGFTPATNLIAIRRLSLNIGEKLPAPAAWLDFPDLQLKKLEQHYHRISEDQYEYAAPDVGYADIVEVDRNGAITHYPTLWEIER